MQVLRTISLLVFTLFLVSGCKLIRQDPEDALLDGEAIETKKEPLKPFSATMPSNLWPPEQRRASASYHYLIAESEALRGNLKEALSKFQLAYNLDPNSFLGGKLIAAQSTVGNFEEALSEARRMVLLYPKSAHLRILYGQLLGRNSQFVKGIDQLKIAIDLDPGLEDAYIQLISYYQETGRTKDALEVALKFSRAIPSSVAAWSVLSRLYILASDKARALSAAKKAFDMQSSNPELILIYAYTLELNKRTAQAVGLYDKIFRLNPANEELARRMLRLYREMGGLKEALALLNEMSSTEEGNRPGVHIQRVLILWELKDFPAAASLASEMVERFPRSDRLIYLAGLAQERVEDFDAALQYYKNIPQESEFVGPANFRIAIVLRSKKRLDEALQVATELIADKTVRWEAYLLLAGVQSDLERFDDAVDSLNLGLEHYPQHPRLLFIRGVNEERAGQLEACIATMKEVIKVNPEESAAYNYLGYLYAEQGRNLVEAEKLILRALQIKPNDGYYLDSLGWVYFKKGQLNRALETLMRALKVIPNEGVVLEHVGDVYEKKGDKAKALEYYEKALKGRLEKKDKKRVEEKLAKFKK